MDMKNKIISFFIFNSSFGPKEGDVSIFYIFTIINIPLSVLWKSICNPQITKP